jgi:hypothetical protein
MATVTQCPTRMPDSTRKHGGETAAVWLEVKPGSSPKCLRPWCLRCLMQGDSVLVAQAVHDFYRSQLGIAFSLILRSVEEERARQRGLLGEAAQQDLLDGPEPAEAARNAELGMLAGAWHSRAVRRLLSR